MKPIGNATATAVFRDGASLLPATDAQPGSGRLARNFAADPSLSERRS
jgi:hypothetical protein